ncbi:MAG: BON domain-containing protein, partial [Acidobacteria bacterium]|nr:BON domain-containing protein [Acidobacteriota bacterium]
GQSPSNGETVPTAAVAPDTAQGGVNHTVKPTRPSMPAPTPQIGTGGNDFFLFTQTRAALDKDDELKNSAIVVEIHEGVVTLNGTAANNEQIKKAARVVQAVAGVKSVKNQLRTSTGGKK